MIPDTRYLIDANVFIQAKNFHYRFEFCQGFWQWLADGHDAGLLFSTAKVFQELNDGNDDDQVKLWANQLPDSFFIPDTHDASVIQAYGQIMAWNFSNNHYTQQAKNEFARSDRADVFLIATAKAHGFKLATHELSKPETKRRVLIPDAAYVFGVNCTMIYDLLSRHAAGTFGFTP
ncbi:DUF4411 family protein [Methylicorpusculum sp.]|uniref:DUF4411 family protein n=1 Tax=Methylicorpusculum sp. TaxID=2713644 RepID=UPI00271F0265|nr:DUF4411 family protein [Methylicorpusculum sp.]MDO8845448.1 DUF4411 family protein [Methylicorpusculum sp.]MDP2177269.1 DUF4411 family protein [Methylicorpusculum sp.]MDP3531194.1 DUF4411 family protein [Methylicorpusculum sp.]MDZ4150404.1 DUF4411 family protein [Methylicorpusculum sp.]